MGSSRGESPLGKLKRMVLGGARNPHDPQLFHKLSLIAFFAWVGLGADGLSSSCYGPEEAFLSLQGHVYLSIFVALASAVTIFIISSSYSQIVELFPTGGGGYLVASKLLSPSLGMISGCALMIDYVLTISLSIASGSDALFSFLPPHLYSFKLVFAISGVLVLTLLNLRGIKESVIPLVPIFILFLLTHAFAIVYAIATHVPEVGTVIDATAADVQTTSAEIGIIGMLLLILRAYSMGAGTFTGIEAVSNGIPILREPKVQTAKKTMRLMAVSLAFMVIGLMIGYLLYNVGHQQGKTLNAIFLEKMTYNWGTVGYAFVLITLLSEAILLFVAAQTGFLDGPRVLSNMALDRWFPSRFAILSDRFVTQNGIMLMGAAAFVLMIASQGSVKLMVVLYSINVFITFLLSQLGMVRHWWAEKATSPGWEKKIIINGIGLILTAFILVTVAYLKFEEGGWITIFITGSLVCFALIIRRHYDHAQLRLERLDGLIRDNLLKDADFSNPKCLPQQKEECTPEFDPKAKTAVILVNGFNGLGLHTILNVLKLGDIRNFFFVEVGLIDAGNFKGLEEFEKLKSHINDELGHYVTFMQKQGFYAEGRSDIGIDGVDETCALVNKIIEAHPDAEVYGGQLVLPKETFFSKLPYNQTTFAVQRRLEEQQVPFRILPIQLG
ncbi:Amino acid permease [uncultured archaeon]|nr:Amino acid permease [uncultured archaeon]